MPSFGRADRPPPPAVAPVAPSEYSIAANGATIVRYIEQHMAADEPAVRARRWWHHVQAIETGRFLKLPTDMDPTVRTQLLSTAAMHAVHRVWARHKTVYSMNPDMVEVLKGSLADQLPGSLFAQQPYSDPLVVFPRPLPTRTPFGAPGHLLGFYVSGRREPVGGKSVMCSTHDPERCDLWLSFLTSYQHPSGEHDINHLRVMVPTRRAMFSVDDAVNETMARFDWSPGLADKDLVRESVSSMIRTALSILVYLCTKAPDFRQTPAARGRRKAGKKGKKAVPRPARMVEVGWTLGPALEQARRIDHERVQREPAASASAGRKQRPHQRRGHLRLYWVGPGRQQAEVKFIAPYEVGVNKPRRKSQRPMRIHAIAPPRRGTRAS